MQDRLALLNRLQGGRIKSEERFQTLPEYIQLLKANELSDVVDKPADILPYDPSRPNG